MEQALGPETGLAAGAAEHELAARATEAGAAEAGRAARTAEPELAARATEAGAAEAGRAARIAEPELAARATEAGAAGAGWTARAGDAELAAGVAAGLERLVGLFRWLSPPSGLSLTAAATLATLERSGPCRLTALADREAVTQPAMTQLVARLQAAGLVTRAADPGDGRVVQVEITDAGSAVLAQRRAVRAERLAAMLGDLSAADRAALTAALPAMDRLTAAQRAEPLRAAR